MNDGHERLHLYFGLSYANYLVVPRSILQSMPDEWQGKCATLLEEMQGKLLEHNIGWPLDGHKQVVVLLRPGEEEIEPDYPDALADYQRGRRRLWENPKPVPQSPSNPPIAETVAGLRELPCPGCGVALYDDAAKHGICGDCAEKEIAGYRQEELPKLIGGREWEIVQSEYGFRRWSISAGDLRHLSKSLRSWRQFVTDEHTSMDGVYEFIDDTQFPTRQAAEDFIRGL